ncbi:MAG: hypothetical protein A2017_11550 [Lentisphaerae bacterium GWF2_44_16]|nr:MAG: hypothetical protein A2017_11550 [Lentisphaerae bacterium GWF2_44_16]
MKKLFWKAVLYILRQISSTDINEQLLRENEYLQAELQIFKAQLGKIKKRPSFTDEQRKLLAEKGRVIGKRLYDLATIVTPLTILRWHRELVAKKIDSSQSSERKVGRPSTPRDIEELILTMAFDNPSWGYLRIAGALKNLGFKISKSTVSNILKNNDINPSGDRKHGGMSWADFIRLHKDVIRATDFFSTERFGQSSVSLRFMCFSLSIQAPVRLSSEASHQIRMVHGWRKLPETLPAMMANFWEENTSFMTAMQNTPNNSMQS